VNCDACQQQLQLTLEGVEPSDTAVFDQHLRDCTNCRTYYDAARRLRAGLSLLRPPAPPPELTRRLVAAVQQDRLLRYRRARRKLFVALAVAASIVVVVGIRLWPGGGKPSPNPPEHVENRPDPEPRIPEDRTATPRKSVESAVEVVASLTTRTTRHTVEETKKLIPLVGPQLPAFAWEPTFPTVNLSGSGQGVRKGFEPVAMHARQAASLLRRDLIPQF
jgi:anti-sigma factor RsiW